MNLYFIRHAQGYHNIKQINNNNLKILYPEVTPLGEEQIKSLRCRALDVIEDIDLILVSPTTRTLQTAHGAFYDNTNKFLVNELIREVLHNPCDYRKSKTELQKKFKDINFNDIEEDDKMKLYEEEIEIEKRCDIFFQWLKNRKEKNIVIVSHGGFLYRFMKKYGDLCNLINKERMKNCELRIGFIKKISKILIDE